MGPFPPLRSPRLLHMVVQMRLRVHHAPCTRNMGTRKLPHCSSSQHLDTSSTAILAQFKYPFIWVGMDSPETTLQKKKRETWMTKCSKTLKKFHTFFVIFLPPTCFIPQKNEEQFVPFFAHKMFQFLFHPLKIGFGTKMYYFFFLSFPNSKRTHRFNPIKKGGAECVKTQWMNEAPV